MRKTYFIKLQDECEEIEDEIIVVETKRNFDKVEEIINKAIGTFYNGLARACDSIVEYIYYILDRNHIKWELLSFDSEIIY